MKRWKMKRAVCLLLAAVLLFSLGGCTAANRPASTGGTDKPTQPNAPAVQALSVNLMADIKPTANARAAGTSQEAAAAAADFALRLFRAARPERTPCSPPCPCSAPWR